MGVDSITTDHSDIRAGLCLPRQGWDWCCSNHNSSHGSCKDEVGEPFPDGNTEHRGSMGSDPAMRLSHPLLLAGRAQSAAEPGSCGCPATDPAVPGCCGTALVALLPRNTWFPQPPSALLGSIQSPLLQWGLFSTHRPGLPHSSPWWENPFLGSPGCCWMGAR